MGIFSNSPTTLCAYCKKPAKLNHMNLCKDCEQWVAPMIKRHLEIIDESYKINMTTRNVKTFYGRIQTYTDNMQKLIEYAKMGVAFPKGMADYFDKLIADMSEKEEQFVCTETVITGGVETVTDYNGDGTIRRQTTKTT